MNNSAHKLWRFHGGLHLTDHKALSMQSAISSVRVPAQLVLPLQQHIGNPATPVVNVGDRVLKYQMIAQAEGYISAPIHASSSGTVISIESRPLPHPSGMSGMCMVIQTDGLDEAFPLPQTKEDYRKDDPSHLRNRIREAGIVGLGGAGFPTYVKLNPGNSQSIDTLILNGAECEPYITCDAMLMQEQARAIIDGILIMRHALQAKRCVIGIEDNKPQAIIALNNAIAGNEKHNISVVAIPTRYPAGGEKQLIYTLTGHEVPAHQLPISIGIVCHNVATAYAVGITIHQQRPLIERVVTVTGTAVSAPGNYWVRIGTPISDVLQHAGLDKTALARLVMGGPMMGFTVQHPESPVIKTTNCLLTLTHSDLPKDATAMPCIRCGECAQVCPAQLLPQQLYWHARAREFDKTQSYNLFDCIECGCCSYVCPSHIPLVHYYRFAKSEIWAKERDKEKSDIARERHDFHLSRIERKKQEDEERKRKKKEMLKNVDSSDDPKKAAIEAALQRVQEKKRTQDSLNPANPSAASEENPS